MAETPSVQDLGAEYRRLWRDYLRTVDNYEAQIAQLREQERQISGAVPLCAIDHGLELGHQGKVAQAILRRMVRDIGERLAVLPTRPVEIDDSEVLRRFHPSGEYDQWDPGQAWEYLVATYLIEENRDLGLRQFANKLTRAFSLDNGEPVEYQKGYLVLRRVCWAEVRGGEKVYSHNTRERIAEELKFLEDLALYIGRSDEAAELRRYAEQRCGYGEPVRSRQTVTLAHGLLRVTTTQKQIEYHLGPELTNALQVLVSGYADHFKSAAGM